MFQSSLCQRIFETNPILHEPQIQFRNASQKNENYGPTRPSFSGAPCSADYRRHPRHPGYAMGPQHRSQIVFSCATSVAWTGVSFFLTGCVMFWGSKVGKLHLRDKIIASIPWREMSRFSM